MHGNKAKLKRPGLASLRCKMTFQIFGLGLIAMQNEFSKFSSLAILRSKINFQIFRLRIIVVQNDFQIFELGLIAVQNDFSNFRAWPYCGTK